MKRLTALALALVMLISPMTASAVTWSEVSAAVKSSGSYSGGGVSATKDGDTTTVTGGSIENVSIGYGDVPSAMIIFKDTNITGEFVVTSSDGAQYVVTLEKGTTVDVEYFSASSNDAGSSTTVINRGEVTSSDLFFADAFAGGTVEVVNEGSMSADGYWHVLSADTDLITDETTDGVHSSMTIENKGTFTGKLHGAADDASSMTITNSGTIDGEFLTQAYDDSNVQSSNSGTVTGDFRAQAFDRANSTIANSGIVEQEYFSRSEAQSTLEMENSGSVGADMWIAMDGEADAQMRNEGSVADDMFGKVEGEAKLQMQNSGTIGRALAADGYQSGSIDAENTGTVGGMFLGFLEEDVSITLRNEAQVQGGIYASLEKGGSVDIQNSGTTAGDIGIWLLEEGDVKLSSSGDASEKTPVYFWVTPYENKYVTEQELYDQGSAIVGKIDVSGLTQEQVDGIVERYNGGEYEGVYQIALGDDGKLYLVLLEEEEDKGGNEPEVITPERKAHLMEMQRKEESIGGVYASPYWCRQLSLGYTNQNLWIHNAQGEKINFREKLSWLNDGTSGKRLSLRVNQEDMTGVTMRLDGTVFDTLERTEIARLTIQNKNGDVYMEYDVSELKAAREMYALAESELLVVGGMDDAVMKVTAQGELLPVEGE